MNKIIYFLFESIFSIYFYLNKSNTIDYFKIPFYLFFYILFEIFIIFIGTHKIYFKILKGSTSYLIIEYLFGKIFHFSEVISILFVSFLQLLFSFTFMKININTL
jgi:hypothetical protein